MAKTTIGLIIEMEMAMIEWEDKTKPAMIEQLNTLTDEQRKELFDEYCRGCATYLDGREDWSGMNYCCSCSPDPRED